MRWPPAVGVETGAGDALAGLVAALKPQHVLIALDNAEHLIDAVARVVRVLIDGAPGLRLLVTSQAPLGLVDAEQVYRLGPLAVPDATLGLGEAQHFGAVALFAERARAADRRFVLSAQNVGTVARVCAQLDGMALAIELAASRVPLLGVDGLASALGERLRVLRTARRDAPPRQQTLHAALDWSYGLLGPQEQAVFRQLGVFAGGFSLEMARHVADAASASPEAPGAWAAVDALGVLVDRSLVSADLHHDSAAAPRYRLLESPRAFALERLAAAGEIVACQRRHAMAVLEHFTAPTRPRQRPRGAGLGDAERRRNGAGSGSAPEPGTAGTPPGGAPASGMRPRNARLTTRCLTPCGHAGPSAAPISGPAANRR